MNLESRKPGEEDKIQAFPGFLVSKFEPAFMIA